MKRLRRLSNNRVVEFCEDIIINILHCLPSKSLARFNCVSKDWHKYIADSSLSYSCRFRRWRPQPNLIGFFYQSWETPKRSQIRFFFSSNEVNNIDGSSLDESVNSLGRKRVYIVASSNGFLLCNDLTGVYYVYNPATRQSLALPKTQIDMTDPFVGFICKVDDPNKDVISFTIVRYVMPLVWEFLSTITIETFSSETNVWTANIKIFEPIGLWLPILDKKSSSTCGAIDGVLFWWLENGRHITAYDSVDKSFWALELPNDEEMVPRRSCYLGISSGALYFALNLGEAITVWRLESNIRSRDAVWVRIYKANVVSTILQCPEAYGLGVNALSLKEFGIVGSIGIKVQSMVIHPAIPHIFYLDVRGKVISYDLETDIAEFVHDFGEYWWRTQHFKLFAYEWHQWPRLL
ncbi:PREDICTED: F-box protein At5g03970-like [Nicotiana attenuata]|uniref:F-box protein n=1 Tax=Nicotiana attenuata TaxID=49451 RepID=A0A1J6ITK8_NICAT|nr:PREDICTED: F-box protein At5g03970-like [Nicotiana attenuata]OIT07588.1 f-box protein [Nicotiana attenuata]